MATTATVKAFRDDLSRDSMNRGNAAMSNALALYAMNRPVSSGAIGLAGTTTKVKTTATITYTIGGQWQTALSATDNFWTLTGPTVAVSSWQKYLLCVDNAQAASVVAGVPSTQDAAHVNFSSTAAGTWGPLIAILNANKIIAGVLLIATDSSHTFIPGTSVPGTNNTATYFDGFDPTLLSLIGNESATLIGAGV